MKNYISGHSKVGCHLSRPSAMIKSFSILLLTALVASCGGGGTSDDNGDNNNILNGPGVTVTENESVTPSQPTEVYQDSFLRLSYPADWTLNTSFPNATAAVVAPESNPLGGNSNCVIGSQFIPGVSLIELVEAGLENGLLQNPEPTIAFLQINGTEVGRLSGLLEISAVTTISSVQQYAYEDEIAHLIACFDVSPDEVNLILNSVEIF